MSDEPVEITAAVLKEAEPPTEDPEKYPVEARLRFTREQLALSREEFEQLVLTSMRRFYEGMLLSWARFHQKSGEEDES